MKEDLTAVLKFGTALAFDRSNNKYINSYRLDEDSSWKIIQITQQTFLVFQDVFKTSWRRLQRNTFRLPRRLEDVLKTYLQDVLQLCLPDVFKTSSRRLGRQKNVTLKTSSRRLQDVFSTFSPRRMFAGQVVDIWFPSFRCYLIHLFTLIQYTLKINQTKQFGNIYVI